MADESGDKQQVRLTIYNRTFSLLVSSDPAEIERVAETVDELMFEIARTGNFDSLRVAIVACLQLGLRLRTLENELSRVRQQVDSRTQEFARLLDGIIEEGSAGSEEGAAESGPAAGSGRPAAPDST